MDIWNSCKKNMCFLRKRYDLTQQSIADRMGISRGCYQHGETSSPTAIFEKLITFWYKNYGITPNELLLQDLTDDDFKTTAQKCQVKKVKVRIKSNH